MEWDIKTLDCSKMLINPLHPNLVGFIRTNIPSLHAIKHEYKAKKFTQSMLYRYILLVYDKESPIQKMHSLDYWEKKHRAACYSGFKQSRQKGGAVKFDSEVDDLVSGKDSAAVDMIVEFLGYQNNVHWNHLVFLYESMLDFTRDSLGGRNRDYKTSQEYRKLYDDFFRVSNEMANTSDETSEFMARFYINIERSRLAIKPEDYSKALNNGDEFLNADSPYGINYEPDKLRFLGDNEENLSL